MIFISICVFLVFFRVTDGDDGGGTNILGDLSWNYPPPPYSLHMMHGQDEEEDEDDDDMYCK